MKIATLRMPDEVSAGDGPSREILLSRVLDYAATPADWDALECLATRDASVWRELAQTMRQDQALTHAVACASHQADMIDLESIERAERNRGVRHDKPREQTRTARHSRHEGVAFKRRLRLVGTVSGWVAAAAIALVFTDGRLIRFNPPSPLDAPTSQASLIPNLISTRESANSSDALREYLRKGNQEGTVLGEMPRKILMQAQPAADGNGYEVVYIRQILERARINDIYRFSEDEAGRTTPVPIQLTGGRM